MESNKKISEYINILKIPSYHSKRILVEGKISDFHLNFQIDPGAAFSCISEKMIKRINTERKTLEAPMRLQTTESTNMQIHEYISIQFILDFCLKHAFQEKFIILPVEMLILLLGEPFLVEDSRVSFQSKPIVVLNTYGSCFAPTRSAARPHSLYI